MDTNYPPEEDLTFGEGPLGQVSPGVATGKPKKYPTLKFEGPGLRADIPAGAGTVSLAWSLQQRSFTADWIADRHVEMGDPGWREMQQVWSHLVRTISQRINDGVALQDAIDEQLADLANIPITAVDLAEYKLEVDTYGYKNPAA